MQYMHCISTLLLEGSIDKFRKGLYHQIGFINELVSNTNDLSKWL